MLKVIYDSEHVESKVYELWALYCLCSQTENWVAITELKWDYNLTDVEAVKFWNILQVLKNRKYV
jgi:hypothetical protein